MTAAPPPPQTHQEPGAWLHRAHAVRCVRERSAYQQSDGLGAELEATQPERLEQTLPEFEQSGKYVAMV